MRLVIADDVEHCVADTTEANPLRSKMAPQREIRVQAVRPENTEMTAITGVSWSVGWRRRLALGGTRLGSLLPS